MHRACGCVVDRYRGLELIVEPCIKHSDGWASITENLRRIRLITNDRTSEGSSG